jgi:pimeloyl-ACP methyl ester carboxylesterase
MENAHGSIRVNAAKITVPTLMLYGSAAGQQNYMQGGLKRADFFEEIPNQEKALVIVPDCGDYGHLQKPRQKIFNIVNDFLTGRGSGGSAL